MLRYERYYISANSTLIGILAGIGASRLADDLSRPVRFGVSEGGMPGWVGPEAHLRAKLLFLMWLFETYGMGDADREECHSVFGELTVSEEFFDRFFLLAPGTQTRPKVTVNADDYTRRGVNPEITQYMQATGNTCVDRCMHGIIQHSLQRHKKQVR